MNIIDSKDWYARINNMPSLEGPTFMVSGTVIVANSAIDATLVVPQLQDRSFGLRLEVVLESRGIGLTALTEKNVSLSLPGRGEITHVTIFHDGKELAFIENVETVS